MNPNAVTKNGERIPAPPRVKVSNNVLRIIRRKSQSPEPEDVKVDDEEKIVAPPKRIPMLLRKSVSPPNGIA